MHIHKLVPHALIGIITIDGKSDHQRPIYLILEIMNGENRPLGTNELIEFAK